MTMLTGGWYDRYDDNKIELWSRSSWMMNQWGGGEKQPESKCDKWKRNLLPWAIIVWRVNNGWAEQIIIFERLEGSCERWRADKGRRPLNFGKLAETRYKWSPNARKMTKYTPEMNDLVVVMPTGPLIWPKYAYEAAESNLSYLVACFCLLSVSFSSDQCQCWRWSLLI